MSEMMTIQSNCIVHYFQHHKKNTKQGTHKNSKTNLTKKYQSPVLTHNSAKQIKKIINNWLLAIYLTQQKDIKAKQRKRRYLVMLTLTLPSTQVESDKEIKRNYLNNFLIKLKYKYPELLYLWVAEKQKNGNVHFHIMVDRWLDMHKVKKMWNDVLENGDYINNFEKKFNHRTPPSTHLKGQKDMTNPSDYLTKYITKAEKSHDMDGKKWACSKELLLITNTQLPFKSWYADYLYYYRDELKCKYYKNDFAEFFYFDGNFLHDYMFHDLYLDNERSYLLKYSKIYPELYPHEKTKKPAIASTRAKELQTKLSF